MTVPPLSGSGLHRACERKNRQAQNTLVNDFPPAVLSVHAHPVCRLSFDLVATPPPMLLGRRNPRARRPVSLLASAVSFQQPAMLALMLIFRVGLLPHSCVPDARLSLPSFLLITGNAANDLRRFLR